MKLPCQPFGRKPVIPVFFLGEIAPVGSNVFPLACRIETDLSAYAVRRRSLFGGAAEYSSI